MKKIKLEFEKEGEGISKSLSAFVRVEDSIFGSVALSEIIDTFV